MDFLLYFLLGIIFTQWIVPTINAILDLLLSFIEVAKSYCEIKITKNAKIIKDITEDKQSDNCLIGFQVDAEEEYYDNDL